MSALVSVDDVASIANPTTGTAATTPTAITTRFRSWRFIFTQPFRRVQRCGCHGCRLQHGQLEPTYLAAHPTLVPVTAIRSYLTVLVSDTGTVNCRAGSLGALGANLHLEVPGT